MKVFFTKQCFQRKVSLLDVACGLFLSTASTSLSVIAAPQGGEVVSGQGSITTPSSSVTQIQQLSNNLVIDWQSFNVSANELVQFSQPSSTSAVLNQINDISPSEIYGSIDANGLVFLINPNGILFGEGAHIQVNGLFATNLEIDSSRFMSGDYAFESMGMVDGMIVNRGVISASTGGVSLVSDTGVVNEGQILATVGSVNLAVAKSVTLDFTGDGMLQLSVSGDVLENAQALDDAIKNTGEIIAEGGDVLISGQVARDVFTNVVNNTGVIKATRVINEGGVITLAGPSGDINNSGTLDVSGTEAGEVVVSAENITHSGLIDASAEEGDGGSVVLQSSNDTFLQGQSLTTAQANNGTGGTVHILGNRVGLFDESQVDASGFTGGGEVLIGGDYQGSNVDVQNASQTYVGANTSIVADATDVGDGGKIIVWADNTTRFYGDVSAKGGANGGDGGFAEVSGKLGLIKKGMVDLTAAHGDTGTLLLDPSVITITAGTADGDDDTDANATDLINDSGSNTAGTIQFGDTGAADPFVIYESEIEAQSATADIILQATDGIGVSGSSTILLASGSDLTMETRNAAAEGSTGIDLTGMTFETQGAGTITLRTGTDGGDAGTANIITGGLTTAGGSVTISAEGSASTDNIVTNGGDLLVTSSTDSNINNSIATAGGNVDIDAGDSVLIDGAITTTGGNLNIDAGVADAEVTDIVNINSPIATEAGNVVINSVGDLIVADTITTTGDADITLTSTDVAGGGDIYSETAVDLVTSGDKITVTSTGSIGQTGGIGLYTKSGSNSADDLVISSGPTGNIRLIEDSNILSSEISINNHGVDSDIREIDITVRRLEMVAGADLNVGDDDLIIRAINSDIRADAGATSVITAGSITLESLTIQKDRDIGYDGNTLETLYVNTDDLTIITGGDISVSNATALTDLTLSLDASQANPLYYTITDASGTGQIFDISDGGDGLSINDVDAKGNMNLSVESLAAASDIYFNTNTATTSGDVNIGTGTFTAIAPDVIYGDAGASVITADDVILTASGEDSAKAIFDIAVNATRLAATATNATASVNIVSQSAIQIADLTTVTGVTTNNGAITITSAGDIDVDAAIDAGNALITLDTSGSAGDIFGASTITTTGTVSVNAGGGIGTDTLNPLLTNAGTLQLTSDGADVAGNIFVSDSAATTSTLGILTTAASAQNVELTGANGWDITDSNVEGDGDTITLTATDGDIERTAGTITADTLVLDAQGATGGIGKLGAVQTAATNLTVSSSGTSANGNITILDANATQTTLKGIVTNQTNPNDDQTISLTSGNGWNIDGNIGDSADVITLTATDTGGNIDYTSGAVTASDLNLDAQLGGIGIGGPIGSVTATTFSLTTGGAGTGADADSGDIFFATGGSFDIATFAGTITTDGATGQVIDLTAGDWSVGSDTTIGDANDSLVLRATTGGITDGGSNKLTAAAIAFSVTGINDIDVTVDAASIAALADNGGGATGSILIDNVATGIVAVDSISGIDGITATDNSITLTTTDANIDIQQDISAGTGDISISANESVVPGDYSITRTGDFRISTSGVLTLTADGGIGASGTALQTNAGTLVVNTAGDSAAGDIYISDSTATVLESVVTNTVGGNDDQAIELSALSWDINDSATLPDGIGDGADTIALTATDGSITHTAGTIVASALTLDAQGATGGIGASGSAILTNTGSLILSSAGDGAAGDIYVTDSTATTLVSVNTSTAASPNDEQTIELAALSWDINDGGAAGIGDTADTIKITATGGDIAYTAGTIAAATLTLDTTGAIAASGTPLLTNAGLLTLTSGGDIYVSDSYTGTSTLGVLTTVVDTAQTVELTGANGWDITQSNVNGGGVAGDIITLTATGGNIDRSGGTLSADSLTLDAQAGGIGIGGGVGLRAPVDAVANTIALTTGGTGTGADADTGDIFFATGGSFDVATFAGVVTTDAATGQLIDLTADDWSVGSDTTIGDANDSLVLRATTGGITDGGSNKLTAAAIAFSVTGINDIDVTVDAASIAALADNGGGATGSILIDNVATGIVAVDSISGIDGITATDNSITLTTTDANIDIQQDISAGTGDISISANESVVPGDYSITRTGDFRISTSGVLTLTADGGIGASGTALQTNAGTLVVNTAGDSAAGDIYISDSTATVLESVVTNTVGGNDDQAIELSALSWDINDSATLPDGIGDGADTIALTATDGSITHTAGTIVASALTLDAQGATGGIGASGSAILTNTGSLILSSAGDGAAGDIYVTDSTATTLVSVNTSTAASPNDEQTIELAALSWDINDGGAAGIGDTADTIKITATGGDIAYTAGTIAAATLTLDTTGAIAASGTPLLTNAGLLTLTSGGDIYVSDSYTGTSTLGVLTTVVDTAQTVELTGANGWDITQSNVNGGGVAGDIITLTATGGNIDRSGGTLSADSLTLDAQAGGIGIGGGVGLRAPVDAVANTIALTTGGTGTGADADTGDIFFATSGLFNVSAFSGVVSTDLTSGQTIELSADSWNIDGATVGDANDSLVLNALTGGFSGVGTLSAAAVALSATGINDINVITDAATIAASTGSGNITINSIYDDGTGAGVLTVGQVGTVVGITTVGGAIDLTSDDAGIDIIENISAGAGSVSLTTTDTDPGFTGDFHIGGVATVTASGGITVSADGGLNTLRTNSSNGAINVTTYGIGAAGDITLIESGDLATSDIIGGGGPNGTGLHVIDITAANILIDANFDVGANTLLLNTAGTITDGTTDLGGFEVGGAKLALNAGGNIDVTFNTLPSVAPVIAATSATGTIRIDSIYNNGAATGVLTVGSVNGINGISTTDANITLNSDDASIDIAQNISAGTGSINLATTNTLIPGDYDIGGVGIISTNGGTVTVNADGSADLQTSLGGGTLALTALGASVNDAGAIDFGATSVGTGGLVVTSGGVISQSGDITVTGTSSFGAGANAIALNTGTNNFTGAVSLNNTGAANDASISDVNDIVLGTVNTDGALNVTAGGSITDIGVQTVDGAAIFTAANAGNIILDSANTYNSAVSFLASAGTLNDVTFINAAAYDVQAGGLAVNGALDITADGITQTGDLTVGTTSSFDAGAAAITLDNAGNDFTGAVDLNNSGAFDVAIQDSNAITLAVSSIGRNLIVTAAGKIAQTGSISVGGTSSFSTGTTAAAIDLTDVLNNFTGAVSLNNTGAFDVAITDANAIVLDTSSIGQNLTVNASGSIAQTAGILTVGGTSSFTTGNAAITLNSANEFTGAVSLNNTGAFDVVVTDADSIILGTSTVGRDLTVNATGTITDIGTITVTGGTTTLSAGAANNIALNTGTNNFNSIAVSSANDVTLIDNSGGVDIAATTISGDYILSSDGSITSSGTLSAVNADLAVTGLSNSLGTSGTPIAVDLSGNLTATASNGSGSVYISDAGDLSIASINAASGNVELSAVGRITDTGADNTVVDITANNLTIKTTVGAGDSAADALNLEVSGLTVTTSTGDFFLTELNALTLRDVSVGSIDLFAGGALTVRGNVTTTAGGITLSSAGILSILDDGVQIPVGSSSTGGGANPIITTDYYDYGSVTLSTGSTGDISLISDDIQIQTISTIDTLTATIPRLFEIAPLVFVTVFDEWHDNETHPDATLNAGTNSVIFDTYTALNAFDLGGMLTAAEIGRISSAGAVQFGTVANTGGVQLTSSINTSAFTDTLLVTSGAVSTSAAANTLTVDNLSIDADTGIGSSTTALRVDSNSISATNSTSGDIYLSFVGNTTVGGVGQTIDNQVAGGAIGIAATGNLIIANDFTVAGTGSVSLDANGTITRTAGTITANTVNLGSNGTTTAIGGSGTPVIVSSPNISATTSTGDIYLQNDQAVNLTMSAGGNAEFVNTAGAINSVAAQAINAAGNLLLDASAVNFANNSTVSSTSGNLIIRADDMEFGTTSSVSGANINLYTQTAAAGFLLGDNTDAADQVELAEAELQALSSSGIVTIGEDTVNTGDIIFGGAVDLSGASFSLTLATEGKIDNTLAAGNTLSLDNGGLLTLDALNVGATNPLETVAANLDIRTNGNVNLNNGIGIDDLQLNAGTGIVDINNASYINASTALIAGEFTFNAVDWFYLSPGSSMTASSGDVSITVAPGAVDTDYYDFIILDDGTSINVAAGNLILTADRMIFDYLFGGGVGTSSLTANNITINPYTADWNIELGSPVISFEDTTDDPLTLAINESATLKLNSAELAMLDSSGTVTIGGAGYSGNVDMGQTVVDLSTENFDFTVTTTGAIDDSTGSGNPLSLNTGKLLTLEAGAGIGDTSAIVFTADNVSAVNTTSGSLSLAPTGNIALGGTGTIDQQADNSLLSIQSGGNIVIEGDVSVSGAGSTVVTLDAAGAITRTGGTVIANTINLGSVTTDSIGASLAPVITDGNVLNVNTAGDAFVENISATAAQLAGTTANITFVQSGAGNLALADINSGVIDIRTTSSDINGVAGQSVVGTDLTISSNGSIGVTETLFVDASSSLSLETFGTGAAGNIRAGSSTLIPFTGLTTHNGDSNTVIGLEAPSFTIDSALGSPLADPASGNLYLYATSGSITLDVGAELNFINLYLGATDGISQDVTSVIKADKLLVGASNNVDLSGANDVNTLAANVTTDGQSFTFNDVDDLSLDQITGYGNLVDTAGIITNNGAINLTTGGVLTQSALGVVSGVVLTTNTDGGTILNSAVNAVTGFNGTDTTFDILLTDSGTLNVTGISTGGNVTLVADSLTQSGSVIDSDQLTTSTVTGSVLNSANTVNGYAATNTTSGNIEFSGAVTTLTLAGIDQSGTGEIITSSASNVNNGGGLDLNAGTNLAISHAMGANAIDLSAGGTISQNGTGTLTGGVLTTDSNGGVTLNVAANDLTGFNATEVSGNVLLSSGNALDITGISTGGNIELNADSLSQSAGVINGNQLTTSTVNGSVLNNTNTVDSYAASNTTSNNIELSNDSATLTLAGIDQNGGGDVIISNTGEIITSAASNVNNGGGLDLNAGTNLAISHAMGANAIDLSAGGTISQNGTGVLTGGVLTTNSNGGVTLNVAANDLTGFNATEVSGNILLSSSNALDVTGISTGGNIELSADSLSQSAGVINGGQLTTNTVNGSVLNNTNTVDSYAATNTTSSNIEFSAAVTTLTLAGIDQSGGGDVIISNTGEIITSAASNVNNGGGLDLNAGTNLAISHAMGANAIDLSAGGTISQNGTGVLTGGVLTTNSNGGVTLNVAANDLTGFNATEVSGNILLSSSNALDVTGISTGGNIELSADSLSQSAGVINGGQLTTNTVNGSVLNNTNTVDSYAATNTTSSNIEFSAAVTTLTLAGIDQSGGDDVIISNTGAIITSGVATVNGAGGLDLSSGTDLTLSHAVTANAVTLSAGGVLTQNLTGILTTGLLTTNSAGGTTLGLNNVLNSFNATDTNNGDILLVDSGALDITGISTGGDISLTTGSLTGSGTLEGDLLTTTTSAGSILDNSGNIISVYTANDSGGGDIVLDNTGSLGLESVTTAGGITISSTGNIAQTDNIESTGGSDISVTSSAGSISMINGLNTTTTGGNITYQASGDLALSLLDAADGTAANVGTVSVTSLSGNILSTDFFNASVRANTVNLTAANNIGQDEVNAFVLSSDIQGKVTLNYAGNAYITTSPNLINLDIDDFGVGVINSGAARSAGTQRSQSSGLEDVGFIDLALFSDINLFVIDGVGIALPADQSDEPPLPGNIPVNDNDEEEERLNGLEVSVFLH